MNKNLIEVEVGVGLADSELISYSYSTSTQTLTVRLEAWNARLVEVTFFDPITFFDNGSSDIEMLCINKSKNDLFDQTISKMYLGPPEENPYQLFQFVSVDGEPCLTVVCKGVKCKVSEKKSVKLCD